MCGFTARGLVLVWGLALAGSPLRASPNDTPDVAVKAAFLFNFARFTVWPSLEAGVPILACVVGDGAIADALGETVRGQQINGHALSVTRAPDAERWRDCHLLFIAGDEVERSVVELGSIRRLPVLTVSDRKDFSRTGGIIELYVEGDRMRFAINIDAIGRSRLRVGSRLLGLAKITRDTNGR